MQRDPTNKGDINYMEAHGLAKDWFELCLI